jgi:hypothetical protein
MTERLIPPRSVAVNTNPMVAVRMFSRNFFFMPERIQKPVEPAPWGPKKGDGDGPRSPDISRPDTKDLLKKMRKVDPNQSKRYRQRTGQ